MMKKLVILCLIGIFLLSGCEQLKELYGIQPSGGEEYVPVEEIKVEEEPEKGLLPNQTEEKIPEIEEIPVGETGAKIEVPAKEQPRKEAKVLIVQEKDLVSLNPKASDPDKDKLVFSYTSPIDAAGKWQTNYGDAGEYTITLTASDGQLTTAKDILIIVNKKEEAPVIDEAIPKESALEAKENSKLEFSIKASDLNKDPLKYSWKLDGNEVSTKEAYTSNIGYDDAGQHTIKATVSDGVKEASKLWSLKIENVNRKPVLEKIADIKVKETEKIVLSPKAADPDKEDKIAFSIDNAKFKNVNDKFEWDTTYDDSGEYSVTVTASDGKDKVTQTLKITVENVNRAPVIEDIVLG